MSCFCVLKIQNDPELDKVLGKPILAKEVSNCRRSSNSKIITNPGISGILLKFQLQYRVALYAEFL